MNEIQLQGTSKTPSVVCTLDPFAIVLSGRSIPENSIEFYRPIMDWVDAHCSKEGTNLDIKIRLEYFNTSSSKCLMDLLKLVEKSPSTAEVHWYYEEEDEDMLEAGEDYDAIIDLPFKLIATDAL
ncbi:MAG: DUF1987 domain-containing protein [Flavobacteriales bacterium]